MYVAPHKRNGSSVSPSTQVNGVHKTETAQLEPVAKNEAVAQEPSKSGSSIPKWGQGATFAQVVKQNIDVPMKEPVLGNDTSGPKHAVTRGISRPRAKAKLKEKEVYVEEDTNFDVQPVTWKNDGQVKKSVESHVSSHIDWGEPTGVRANKATLKREGKKRLDEEYRRQKAIMTKGAQRAGVEVLPLMESFGAFAQKQQQWKGKK